MPLRPADPGGPSVLPFPESRIATETPRPTRLLRVGRNSVAQIAPSSPRRQEGRESTLFSWRSWRLGAPGAIRLRGGSAGEARLRVSVFSRIPSLLQVHRHDHVLEVRAAFEQAGAVGGAEFEGDLVAIHDLQGIGQEAGIEADLHVGAFELGGE